MRGIRIIEKYSNSPNANFNNVASAVRSYRECVLALANSFGNAHFVQAASRYARASDISDDNPHEPCNYYSGERIIIFGIRNTGRNTWESLTSRTHSV